MTKCVCEHPEHHHAVLADLSRGECQNEGCACASYEENETPSVYKESVWNVDVAPTIAGLREAAEKLSAAGVPADASLVISDVREASKWMHIEAHMTYFPDDDDEASEDDPDPVTGATQRLSGSVS